LANLVSEKILPDGCRKISLILTEAAENSKRQSSKIDYQSEIKEKAAWSK